MGMTAILAAGATPAIPTRASWLFITTNNIREAFFRQGALIKGIMGSILEPGYVPPDQVRRLLSRGVNLHTRPPGTWSMHRHLHAASASPPRAGHSPYFLCTRSCGLRSQVPRTPLALHEGDGDDPFWHPMKFEQWSLVKFPTVIKSSWFDMFQKGGLRTADNYYEHARCGKFFGCTCVTGVTCVSCVSCVTGVDLCARGPLRGSGQ